MILKKSIKLLALSTCLISSSIAMEKLSSINTSLINDIFKAAQLDDALQKSNISNQNEAVINNTEDDKSLNSNEPSLQDDKNNEKAEVTNNNQNNETTHKKKKKRKHRKKNKKSKEASFMDSDEDKAKFKRLQDRIDDNIQSNKFKMLGNIHKKIKNYTKEQLYYEYNIDADILNKYNQYTDKLVNDINDLMQSLTGVSLFGLKFYKIMNNSDEILINIHNLLTNSNLKVNWDNIDEIMQEVIDEEIDSKQDLKGNNFLKIIENLAVAISDWCLYTQSSMLQFFGSGLTNSTNFATACKQLKKIGDAYGII